MIRVLIADDNQGFCSMVAKYLEKEESLHFVGSVNDGAGVIRAIDQWNPDLLLLDLVMPNRDGIDVLEELALKERRPKVIIMSAFGQDEFVSKTTELGVDYYLMKPFTLPTLVRRIHQVFSMEQEGGSSANQRQMLYERLAHRFSKMGVPPHYKGYRYLVEAVLLVCADKRWLTGITKHLYPEIGRRFGTSAGQVERAIRHALEVTWEKGDAAEIAALFPSSRKDDRGKPTNSSFIAKMADVITMEHSSGTTPVE